MVSKFDLDFDSQLDIRDFIRLVTEGSKEVTREEVVSDMFYMIDRDNDGLLGKEDIAGLMLLFGEEISEEELKAVFQIFDESEDGNIDLVEFSDILFEEDDFKKAFLF